MKEKNGSVDGKLFSLPNPSCGENELKKLIESIKPTIKQIKGNILKNDQSEDVLIHGKEAFRVFLTIVSVLESSFKCCKRYFKSSFDCC